MMKAVDVMVLLLLRVDNAFEGPLRFDDAIHEHRGHHKQRLLSIGEHRRYRNMSLQFHEERQQMILKALSRQDDVDDVLSHQDVAGVIVDYLQQMDAECPVHLQDDSVVIRIYDIDMALLAVCQSNDMLI